MRQDRLETGIEGLDRILNGGLLRGAAYMVNGPPGSGKTILSNKIVFHEISRGGKALYISLLSESHDRMFLHLRTMNFFDESKIGKAVTYISGFSTLESEGLTGLLRLVNREIRRLGASLVILDGLFVAHDLAGEEKDFRRFVHELQGQGNLMNCTLLLLTNQSRAPTSPEHTMVDGWIELYYDLKALREVRSLSVRKQRGDSFLTGRHFYKISDEGPVVYPRLEASSRSAAVGASADHRVPSGIDDLDTMLDGGFPAVSSGVITGPTGSGKTTMGLHFMSKATPEAPGVWFGFYEKPERLAVKARSIGIDLPDLVQRGALEVIWQPPSEHLLDELADRLLSAAKRLRPARIFVDGLGAMTKSAAYPERIAAFASALTDQLVSMGATVLVTAETSDLFMPRALAMDDFSAIFENVIMLHYVRKDDDLLARRLSILKVRDSDFDPVSEEFHISASGVQFGEKPRRLRPTGRSMSRSEAGPQQPPSNEGG